MWSNNVKLSLCTRWRHTHVSPLILNLGTRLRCFQFQATELYPKKKKKPLPTNWIAVFVSPGAGLDILRTMFFCWRCVQLQHRLHYAGSLIKWRYRKHRKGEFVPLCYELPRHSHRDSTNNISKRCCKISPETTVLRIRDSVNCGVGYPILLSTGKRATTQRNLLNILSNARS